MEMESLADMVSIYLERQGADLSSIALLDGLGSVLLGLACVDGSYRAVYSSAKILAILESQGMTKLEAQEYFSFNILELNVSERMPIFLEMELAKFTE